MSASHVRDLPERDTGPTPAGTGGLQGSSTPRNVRCQRAVSRISRAELEDRFLQLSDETLLLKQHANEQEEKLKRVTTKLRWLTKEKKKLEQVSSGPKQLREAVKLDATVKHFQERVNELEKQNASLQNKLVIAAQQVRFQSRSPCLYSCVQPHVRTGLRKASETAGMPEHTKRGVRFHDLELRSPNFVLPRYGESMLEDPSAEIKKLETVIEAQREQIEQLEHSREILLDHIKQRGKEVEESVLRLKEQETTKERLNIRDNVEMIKVRKQLLEKSNALSAMEDKFLQLQENQRNLKMSHDVLIAKNDELTLQLKEERLKRLNLEKELQSVTVSNERPEEFQERIKDLEKENELLKENYDELYNSVFSMTRQQDWLSKEKQLKEQIANLQTAIKSTFAKKNEIIDQIKAERDQKKKLMEENKDLQLCYQEQKQQLEELKEQVKRLTKEDDTDVAELSEAVLLTKVEKPQKEGDLMFLEEEDKIHKDLEHSMKELQLTHMETVQELEKTRNMLIVQHKITKDYQAEVEAVTRKMESLQKDCEGKLEQYGHLLDKKSERIRKLEAQLSDIFYGTKPQKTRQEILTSAPVHEFDQPLHLERGQNLLEIHISKVILSSRAVQAFGDHELATFCTYGFYDFELEITPLAYGHTPSFDFTSQYLVQADECLLNYLQENSVTLEVHHACGIDHETVATCQLKLQETLENNEKIYSTAHLVGTKGHVRDYGTLEYWVRLRLPMERAIGHYKQRSKALGYITFNFRDREQPSQQQILRTAQVSTSTGGNLNEVHITVKCCNNLQSRKNNLQPDPYVVYKFFDFEDHDTPIVPSSNNPQIDDHMCFQVPMNADLDRYLKTESLSFYVFDDGETDKSAYVGKAKVPLISLAHDRSISGTFELTHPERHATGTITVELKRKLVYRPPSGLTVSADFVNDIQNEKSMATELQVEEQMETPDVSPSSVTKPTPKPRQHAAQAEKKVSFPDLRTMQMEVKDMAQEIQQEKERSPLPKGPLTDQSSVTSEGKTKVTEELETEELRDEQKDDDVESITTDSDDCIIISSPVSKLKATEKIVIEILSLRLTDSRIVSDETIKQLFVECRLHNVIAEETPLSLPKPKIGQKIYYHFGCVIHVDKANHSARRDYLKSMLLEPDLHTDRLRFAVVSDPLACEQDLECQDIGFAYVSLREILREGRDIIEQDIDFFDSQDANAVIGQLRVSVEALQVLRSVREECVREEKA